MRSKSKQEIGDRQEAIGQREKEHKKVFPPYQLIEPRPLNPQPCPLNLAPVVLKKRPCPDCRFCQGCSQDRCRLCRSPQKAAHKKLSISEQIALYERINKKKTKRKQ
ncbi:MAG: hypothetical protein A2Y79_13655 [Deltaproteobacteria bacterium RBG_13_43_22]|nr:MAG: hypothetical protein A2Y79_13655 [Deltaproteobacteria bacterium RBG_13_43_22]